MPFQWTTVGRNCVHVPHMIGSISHSYMVVGLNSFHGKITVFPSPGEKIQKALTKFLGNLISSNNSEQSNFTESSSYRHPSFRQPLWHFHVNTVWLMCRCDRAGLVSDINFHTSRLMDKPPEWNQDIIWGLGVYARSCLSVEHFLHLVLNHPFLSVWRNTSNLIRAADFQEHSFKYP